MLEDLKERVSRLNPDLDQYPPGTVTSGNISGRDPETNLVVITPSGLPHDQLTADDMVVVSPDGDVVEGGLKPSVDTATHLHVYRERPDLHGVVHTHSAYATAFAASGRSIPVILTAMADHFGGPIIVAPYAAVGGADIGRQIVEHLGNSSAILLKHHGLFTVGDSPEAAFKTAVIVENMAKTCFLALQLGECKEIPDQEAARAHKRYQERYGQRT